MENRLTGDQRRYLLSCATFCSKDFVLQAHLVGIEIESLTKSHALKSSIAILALYFNLKLNLDPNLSTSLYHVHDSLSYTFTIVGAIISDSWWGQFKTVAVMQLVYAIGGTIVSVGNIEPLNLPLG